MMANLKNANVNKKPPATGLVSPADMKIIQLEATNACPKRCSNCTRFVSHQRKPFVADREQWEQMLRSMEGFGGMVGFMGGEPTIHPDFDWMVRRYREQIGGGHIYQAPARPIPDFSKYYQAHLTSIDHPRGLWTSLGPGYYKHFGLIQETFPYQCVNDHSHPGLHQALLVSYKDLGMSREEFEAKRDKCWVQRMWSASVMPWGTYFCEVAAAIDHLFYQGANAWPLEPGWFRRKQADFGEQLKLCEHCSACLDVPRRPATDEVEDVSESNRQLLVQLQSPAVKHDAVAVVTSEDCAAGKVTCNPNPSWYMEQPDGGKKEDLRVGPTNRTVYPRSLACVQVCVGRAAHLALTLPRHAKLFDQTIVVTTPDDTDTQAVVRGCDFATLAICDEARSDTDRFNKGKLLNAGLNALSDRDWVLFTDSDILLPSSLRDSVMNHVLNPNVLYWTTRYQTRPAGVETLYEDWAQLQDMPFNPPDDQRPWGFFQLWNVRAECLRDLQPLVNTQFPTAGGVDHHFSLRWPDKYKFRIDSAIPGLGVGHLTHGSLSELWGGQPVEVLPTQWSFHGWVNPNNTVHTLIPVPFRGQLRMIALDNGHDNTFTLQKDRLPTHVRCQTRDGQPFPQQAIKAAAGETRNSGSKSQIDFFWRPYSP